MTSKSEPWEGIDFRAHPELYRVGRGEQGVLTAEPYKGEILPHWRFAKPAMARVSAKKILRMFRVYASSGDYVGADMARKFLQMGYTRSRRYARHRSGRKYDGPVPEHVRGVSGSHGRRELPLDPDPVKDECAALFKAALVRAESHRGYAEWRTRRRASERQGG